MKCSVGISIRALLRNIWHRASQLFRLMARADLICFWECVGFNNLFQVTLKVGTTRTKVIIKFTKFVIIKNFTVQGLRSNLIQSGEENVDLIKEVKWFCVTWNTKRLYSRFSYWVSKELFVHVHTCTATRQFEFEKFRLFLIYPLKKSLADSAKTLRWKKSFAPSEWNLSTFKSCLTVRYTYSSSTSKRNFMKINKYMYIYSLISK